MPVSVLSFFEPRFGQNLGQVRVHSNSQATNVARTLNAQAFTIGQDIYFESGRYQPNTTQGKQLLAHELVHTVQQSNSAVGAYKGEPTHSLMSIQSCKADRGIRSATEWSAGVGTIMPDGTKEVQRFPDTPSRDEGASGAEGVINWITTTVGQATVEGANALAKLYGGSVALRGACLVITIPEIPIFPSFQKTLGETPPAGFFIPLLEGGIMVGPIPVVGMFGILGYAQGSAEAAVGPGVLRGIRVEICPFSGRYLGTAQLYAAAAIAPRLTLFGGLFAAAGTVIPIEPPIPVIVIIQGGLRGTGTGWFIGAVQDTVTLLYSGGRLSFSNVTELIGGVLLQGDVDLFGALRLYEKIICQYVYPLKHWETGKAWKLTIPIRTTLGGGRSGTGVVGPITWGPMPIKDIETAIRPLPTGWSCLGWAEIKQFLCDKKILPPELCKKEEPGEIEILKKQLALAICKCQARKGPEPCGAGIYKKCFYVDDKKCKKFRELLKEAQYLCNHKLPECEKPACEMHHVDAKCPVKEEECKHGYFGAEEPVTLEAPCPVPVKYRQTKAQNRTGGVLYFEYVWESSTGTIADLKDCEVGEHVSYPGGSPYVWPSPPWDGGSTPNPTVIWLLGTDGALGDTHSSEGFKKPYKEAKFTATQYYRYQCPCTNSGKPVNLMGPISIVREVRKKPDGNYKYTITKSGKSAKIDPLP